MDPENEPITIGSDQELLEATSVGMNNNNTLVINLCIEERNKIKNNKLNNNTSTHETQPAQPALGCFSRNLHFISVILLYYHFYLFGIIAFIMYLYRNRYCTSPRSLSQQIDACFDWLQSNWDSISDEVNSQNSPPVRTTPNFQSQLRQLNEMGLMNEGKNIEALLKTNGALDEAIDLLTNQH